MTTRDPDGIPNETDDARKAQAIGRIVMLMSLFQPAFLDELACELTLCARQFGLMRADSHRPSLRLVMERETG